MSVVRTSHCVSFCGIFNSRKTAACRFIEQNVLTRQQPRATSLLADADFDGDQYLGKEDLEQVIDAITRKELTADEVSYICTKVGICHFNYVMLLVSHLTTTTTTATVRLAWKGSFVHSTGLCRGSRVPTHPSKYLYFLFLNSRPWKYLKTGQVLKSP